MYDEEALPEAFMIIMTANWAKMGFQTNLDLSLPQH